MQSDTASRDNSFVVIRHLRERGEYAVEYGCAANGQGLRKGPRFPTLDHAIAWVETLDRTLAQAIAEGAGSTRVG